jgi:hypothetical protein
VFGRGPDLVVEHLKMKAGSGDATAVYSSSLSHLDLLPVAHVSDLAIEFVFLKIGWKGERW